MSRDSLFLKINSVSSNKKIFFFHHAGGSAAQYKNIFSKLDVSSEIYILNLPGRVFSARQSKTLYKNQPTTCQPTYQSNHLPAQRTIGQPIYRDYAQLIEDITKNLLPHRNSEIFLLGHSMGALLVFGLLQKLEQDHGISIKSFGLSAISAPLPRFRKRKLGHLSDHEFLEEIEKFQGLPLQIKNDPELLSATVETLKNDFKLIETFNLSSLYYTHRSKGYVFGGSEDKIAEDVNLQEWEKLIKLEEPPIILSGDHFYIFHHLKYILDKLGCLTGT